MDFKTLLEKYGCNDRKGIIHIGGHIGEEIPMYKELGFKKVLTFEPLSVPFSQIPTGEEIYNEQCAIGSENKEVEMFVANNYQSSSILQPVNHLIYHPSIAFDGKELVKVVSLDWYFENNNHELKASDFDVMVIDAQGYEGEVVAGAEKTLHHMKVVYSEINAGELYKDCIHIFKLDEILKTKYSLDRKETLYNQLTAEGEAIYVRN
jgi:FkbM family methyltransferase